MEFKIACNKHHIDGEVEEFKIMLDGMTEAKLECGCWVYFKIDRFIICSESSLSETKQLGKLFETGIEPIKINT